MSHRHLSAILWPLYSHVGLQLVESIVPVFGDELRAIDGKLLVGVHRDHHIPNVRLGQEEGETMSLAGGMWEPPGYPTAWLPRKLT